MQIQIKDLNRIYAVFVVADSEEKNQMIKSICDSLERDRLALARYFSTAYKVPASELFVRESLAQKLKTVGTVLAATIPIVISIIALILELLQKTNTN